MDKFENVSVIKKANIYHDGKVTSRTVRFTDGSRKTLGIMLPGDYSFGTEAAEDMEIMAGELDVLLPGNPSWQNIKAPRTFHVPADSRFELKVRTITDYCCSYHE